MERRKKFGRPKKEPTKVFSKRVKLRLYDKLSQLTDDLIKTHDPEYKIKGEGEE